MKTNLIKIITFILLISTLIIACGTKEEPVVEDSVSDTKVTYDSVSEDDISDKNKSDSSVSTDGLTDELKELSTVSMNEIMDNYEYYSNVSGKSMPTGMSCEVITGYNRDVFFANGTSIQIIEPDADVSEYVHAVAIQNALGNGLGPDNRGYGAIIVWESAGMKMYVVVSNMAEVFGGSYDKDIKCDINIDVDGSEARKSYPNVSFLFGGGMNSNVLGDVNISVTDGAPLYIYGGGFNGSVFGNVSMSYSGNSYSSDIVGGSLVYPLDANEYALVDGDVYIHINSTSRSVINSITGGGLAYSDGEYVALSDVTGNSYLSIRNQSVYEVCGGGISQRANASSAMAVSNVYGNTLINFKNSKLCYENKNGVLKAGILYSLGMTEGGVSEVLGEGSVSVNQLKNDNKALGVIEVQNSNYDLSYYATAYTDSFSIYDVLGLEGFNTEEITDEAMTIRPYITFDNNYNHYLEDISSNSEALVNGEYYSLYDEENEVIIYRPTPANMLLWRQ